ncbi:MAG: peptidoglycan-binding protein [Candidatus Yonathbacteria bacterium]|nr:peptidoglycan-binding protein [Candidatus Yonathbacteria bacterium]
MSIATHNSAGTSGFAAGDTIWISSAGGTLYGPLTPPSTQGTSGSPIIYSSISGETLPHIRATTIQTGWVASSTAPTIYSLAVASDPTFSQSTTFGVWEDDAPLLNARLGNTAAALINMRPGTFFWSSGTLYVWTYESNSPASHTMEVSNGGSTAYALSIGGNYDVNHLRINGLWFERAQNAGILVQGNSSIVNDIVLNNIVIIDNDTGYKASGNASYSTSVQLNNSDIVHNAYISIFLAANKNATLTLANGILGDVLGSVPLAIQATGVVNIGTDSIVIGTPRGRYWLSQYSGGTVNGTPTYLNSQFVNAGATTGLSAALMSIGRSTDDVAGGTQPIAYNMLANLKGVNSAYNMSEQLVTQWIENLMHSNGLTVTQAWAQQQQYVALGGEVTPASRNHIRWASTSFGTDYTNIFTLKYTAAATTATASFDGRYLTTTINGVGDLNLDTTNTNYGGYDLSVLGYNVAPKTGLAGWIAANATNYTFTYSNPGPVDTQTTIATTAKIASSVVATQSGVNINNVSGNFALASHSSATATNLFGTELWDASNPTAAGNTWMADYNTGIVLGGGTALTTPPTTFSWPYTNWSLDEIKVLGNTYGMKGSIAAIYNSSSANAALNLYNQFYPGAMPILFPESTAECFDFGGLTTTGCHTGYSSSAASTAMGVAEGENQAAFLSAWDASTQIFGENYGTTSQDLNSYAVTSYAQTMNTYSIPIKQISYPYTSLISASAAYDSNTNYVTMKIVPTYNFSLKPLAPGIDAGTTVSSVTTDILGNHIYGTPDLGGYEYQPPYTIGTNNIDITGSIRLYKDGKYRYTTATSSSPTANLTVTPVGGFPSGDYSEWLNVSISTWNTSGTYSKTWTETSSTATSTAHTIGDLKTNTYYSVLVDGAQYASMLSNGSGQGTFTYSGGYSTHTFNITEDTTAPTTFSLISPAGTTGASTQTFSWNASTDASSGLAKYQLFVDGALNQDNLTVTSTTASGFSCGNHTWYIRAVDNAGNTTDSSAYTYTTGCGGGGIFAGTLSNITKPRSQIIYPDGKIIYLNEAASATVSKEKNTTPISPVFARTLKRGSRGDDVSALQKFLKKDGTTYHEGLVTGYFGPLTENAIKRFQKKHDIVSSGNAYTTGYGVAGPKTRKKLEELLTSTQP